MVPLALVPNLVTRRGRHLHKYQAGEVTQVMESIPWVRCAIGNVFKCVLKALAQEDAKSHKLHLFAAQFVQRQE